MNGVLPSLCLLGATLATANMFIMQRPTCHSPASNVAMPSLKTVVLDIGKAEPANAPIRPKPPVRPKGVDVTGSVEQSKEADAATGKDAASTKTGEAAVSAGEDVTGSVKQTKTDPKQSAQAESKLHNDPTYARPRRRGYGWRWDWYPPPPAAFGMRVYPGW
jgi:hypothetical protein